MMLSQRVFAVIPVIVTLKEAVLECSGFSHLASLAFWLLFNESGVVASIENLGLGIIELEFVWVSWIKSKLHEVKGLIKSVLGSPLNLSIFIVISLLNALDVGVEWMGNIANQTRLPMQRTVRRLGVSVDMYSTSIAYRSGPSPTRTVPSATRSGKSPSSDTECHCPNPY